MIKVDQVVNFEYYFYTNNMSVKATIKSYNDFDERDLTIYLGDNYIKFMYWNKTQTWVFRGFNIDDTYKYELISNDKVYKIGLDDISPEALVVYFKGNLLHDFTHFPYKVDD